VAAAGGGKAGGTAVMGKMETAAGPRAPSPSWRGAGSWRHINALPRPIRFLGVGAIGLLTDLTVFSLVIAGAIHPLAARLASLGIATVVTWRLNRAVTFAPSGRHQSAEALRYALVTAAAQGTNYAVFAVLVMSLLRSWPQAALLAGAAAGAVLSYAGHGLFSFARASRRRVESGLALR